MFKAVFMPALIGIAAIASPPQVKADDIPTIRVGWTIPAEEAKYLMMRRPELFPDLGKTYKIQWIQFQGTSPMVQAMIAGALDCSTQGALSLAQGADAIGFSPYIVAQHLSEKPGYFSVYWAVKADSPIKTVADLKGKTVGINVLGSGIYGPMAVELQKAGLDPQRDINLVETGFPGSEDAIRGGRVDAGVMNQPFAARAEAKGGLRKLFSMEDAQKNIVLIFDACSKTFVDKNPELAKRYVRDLTAGMALALADRERTIKVDSEVMHVPVPVLESYLLTKADAYRDPTMKPDLAGIQALFDIYKKAGMLKKTLNVKDYARDDVMAPLPR